MARVAEPEARGDEPVACDPVEQAGVEVVDDRRAVAVEVVGDHGRRGRGERGQLRLDLPLQHRAPEGKPLASDLLQLREDESLLDRARGQVAHGEQRARAVPERECRLPRREFLNGEQAAGDGGAEDVELGRLARADVVRERAVAPPQEGEGDRVRMPDDLEGLEHSRPS